MIYLGHDSVTAWPFAVWVGLSVCLDAGGHASVVVAADVCAAFVGGAAAAGLAFGGWLVAAVAYAWGCCGHKKAPPCVVDTLVARFLVCLLFCLVARKATMRRVGLGGDQLLSALKRHAQHFADITHCDAGGCEIPCESLSFGLRCG